MKIDYLNATPLEMVAFCQQASGFSLACLMFARKSELRSAENYWRRRISEWNRKAAAWRRRAKEVNGK